MGTRKPKLLKRLDGYAAPIRHPRESGGPSPARWGWEMGPRLRGDDGKWVAFGRYSLTTLAARSGSSSTYIDTIGSSATTSVASDPKPLNAVRIAAPYAPSIPISR